MQVGTKARRSLDPRGGAWTVRAPQVVSVDLAPDWKSAEAPWWGEAEVCTSVGSWRREGAREFRRRLDGPVGRCRGDEVETDDVQQGAGRWTVG